MPFKYKASGSLELKDPTTLSEVEAFCKEARRLGVGENDRLFTTRQGIVGPITGWFFSIPVIPKSIEE